MKSFFFNPKQNNIEEHRYRNTGPDNDNYKKT